MHTPDDTDRYLMDGVVREIEEAKIGFTARPCKWLRITVKDNNGTQIMVEEQTIEINHTWEYWVDEDGPGSALVETETNIGHPTQEIMHKGRLWKYFEHLPDVYSMRP